MEIILHPGAHRCATRSFLAYLEDNAPALAEMGLVVWGPEKARSLLAGVIPGPGPLSAARQLARAEGRIALHLATLDRRGVARVLIVAPSVLGAPGASLRAGRIYPGAGARLARVLAAFGGRISRVALSIRAPERYWASVWAMALLQGHPLPDGTRLDRLATQPRSWRALIGELAEAAPGADLLVLPHERFAGLPELRLARMLAAPDLAPDLALPRDRARLCLGRSPDLGPLRKALAPGLALPPGEGAFRPFTAPQRAALAESYQDDLFWLTAGADGLARLAADPWPEDARAGMDKTGAAPAPAPEREPNGEAPPGRIDPRARLRRRGQGDDIEEGRMGRAR
ncbi:hypothetical protein [Pseudooceanicola marinus]|uniref:hypothetical protein n=1 Tax=Pseudooceanicola marinus TaxID=396013 RepID=UPI001CD4D0C8|nr:hypothetical protein [Pseudooceanicola marinus]MCA1337238.1 hypothetical protein [Pseudooceanicola marinus]